MPALLGWRYGELDAELRKAFEVALHAGTAAALLIGLRREVAEALRDLDAHRMGRHALEFLPAGLVAGAFERRIEGKLGAPRGVAAAQVMAGALLGAADRAPTERERTDAGFLDALAIGCAQATALAPGVSRNGATLTAARLLRFRRDAANQLSRHAALPIILAATGLKGFRLARRGMDPELRIPFAAGALASFASTLAATRLVRAMDAAPSYLPFAVYRVGLGAAGLAILRRR